MMNLIKKFRLATVVALMMAAAPATAATILSIEDAGRGSGSTAVGTGQVHDGVSQSFTALQDFTDVSFSFNLTCFSCMGELLFMYGTPSLNATAFDDIAVANIDSTTTGIDVFTGFDLAAGQVYSMILTITSGDAIWRASENPIVGGTGGVEAEDGYLLLTAINTNFVPWSPTEPRDGATLQFSLTTDVAAVPLPAGVIGLASGLFALGLFRRRRS